MVPWTHWREPRLGRLLTEWTSEFTVFNLVIRLSIGKQSAFFQVSPVVVGVLNNVPPYLASLFCRAVAAVVSCAKPSYFSTLLERQINITAT